MIHPKKQFHILNDAAIRAALLARLRRSSPQPKQIIEELHVHNGNAIADVVALYKHAHCYEIKGATDNVHRLNQQARYFNLVFSKVTLVTTENHLRTAERVLPTYWGLMKAGLDCNGQVRIWHIRPSKENPLFDKRVALLTLWKDEMQKIVSDNHERMPKNATRKQLADFIAVKFSQREVVQTVAEQLVARSI